MRLSWGPGKSQCVRIEAQTAILLIPAGALLALGSIQLNR